MGISSVHPAGLASLRSEHHADDGSETSSAAVSRMGTSSPAGGAPRCGRRRAGEQQPRRFLRRTLWRFHFSIGRTCRTHSPAWPGAPIAVLPWGNHFALFATDADGVVRCAGGDPQNGLMGPWAPISDCFRRRAGRAGHRAALGRSLRPVRHRRRRHGQLRGRRSAERPDGTLGARYPTLSPAYRARRSPCCPGAITSPCSPPTPTAWSTARAAIRRTA